MSAAAATEDHPLRRNRDFNLLWWRSTWTAGRGFLLIGTGVLMAVFEQWLVAALGVAGGVLALLYARRKYPEWQARRRR
jgi:hypothetical protein